jgi:Copper type II ascorbate-dependent monooxygenase, C-terminal domain
MDRTRAFDSLVLWLLVLGATGSSACETAEPEGATPFAAADAAVVVASPGAVSSPGGSAAGAPPTNTASGPGPAVSGLDAGTTPANPAGPSATNPGASAAGSWCQAKKVFDKYCVSCHDGQGTAGTPMGLKSYADLSALSTQYPGTKIYSRALTRMKATSMPMPPQGTVAPADLALLESWVQAGAPMGADPTCAASDAPAAPAEFAWPKDCEKFYKILAHDANDKSKPFVMGANLESHPQFVFDAPWGNDEVQGLAFKPVTDNKRVLHHWILYQNNGGAFLTGWAPGQDASKGTLPNDVGMFLPSGSQSLRLDMHYNNLLPTSKDELDASGVEICVVTKPKFRANTASVFMGFAGIGLPMVPANAVNYDLTGICTVAASAPVHLLTTSAHAHRLATHTKFTVQKKSGTQIVMHDEPFNFDEQTSTALPMEVVLETGDTVNTTCKYSNPTSQDIQFGENTDNEMCFNFAVYYPKDALNCDLLGGLLGAGGGGLIGGLLGP